MLTKFRILKSWNSLLTLKHWLSHRAQVCITTSENILANENLCFRVFKLQLKVINKNFCYLYSVQVNQFNQVTLPLIVLYLFQHS